MFNKNNLIKYLILFSVVSLSTYMIPNCSILNLHAMYIGLLAGTTFVLLDKFFPHTVVVYDNDKKNLHDHF
jgi:hypothetical protein